MVEKTKPQKTGEIPHLFKDSFVIGVEATHFHKHANQVHIIEDAGGCTIHVAVNGFLLVCMYSGRIDKNQLHVILGFYP